MATGQAMGRRTLPIWQFTPGAVGYAVGDIHGCADLLTVLLDRIEDDIATLAGLRPIVVFLGDYVDRGPDSRAVIECLLHWRDAGHESYFLRGNHEQAMRAFMDDPAPHRAWISHGGAQTLASYGVDPPSLGANATSLETCARALRQAVPAEHHRFFEALRRYAVLGDYAFVHAGIDPRRAIELQDDVDLYWTRGRFLNASAKFSHCVVHGHTPASSCYRDDRRIGVDTGAYASGTLSAARLVGGEVTFLEARREDAHAHQHGEFA